MKFPKKANYTSDELKKARRAGFKRKRPKQPKRVTENSVSNYLTKYNEWVRELKAAAKNYGKKKSTRKTVAELRKLMS
jgi:hypothetical protein